ncbi:MAG: thioredoxin-dependent thiol peroxidase [Elusimicrobia bacterium]|nr:thioredoxin-dependent thiol peroxidase [Elusimicrobiota bacterium]
MATKTTKAAELKAGDAAPGFEALDETGAKHSLKSYRGRTVILYFYPKDDTPGCTQESCDFRDLSSQFGKKKAVILGVSPDSAKSHQKFKDKHGLSFPLLVDEDKALCQAYGVWKEKSMYGRTYMGVERSTFVIGPDGRIVEAHRKVSVSGHAKSILETL